MKALNSNIYLQEIPDEVSLGLSITDCPYRCKFCHTPELQKDVGTDWQEVLDTAMSRYQDAVSCVLFLGGDGQWEDLRSAAKYVKRKYNKKVAVYLGAQDCPEYLFELFDYIKVGPYVHELGGLSSRTTNQRLYKINNAELEDITYKFWRNDK